MRSWHALVLLHLALAAPAPAAVEGLLATRPGAFAPVTMVDGQPRFVIPPGSRLATNTHPRCLLTGDDLAVLRRRRTDPRLATQWQALERQAAKPWSAEGGACIPALLWKLTGDTKYLDAIRSSPEFQTPSFLYGWAATMDLIWDDLTPGERATLSNRVTAAVAQGGALYWRATLPLVSVFYEGGRGPNDAALLARMQHDHQDTLVRWTDKLNRWSAGRGGSDMGHGYNGEHAYWEPFSAAIAWSHATGEDYLGRAVFAKYESAFYWYHFLPGLEPLTVEKLGVTRTADDPSAVTPAHCGANHLLFLTFTREHDGLGLAWMEKYRTQEPNWSRDREAMGRFLWWDPDQPALDPASLPTTRLFPTSGHVTMRSDWSAGATFATFRCGRWGEIDGGWGRNNADNLSFTLRKLGPLAIDSGPVHGQNLQVLKFLAPEGANSALSEYGRQTVAHNTITIGDGEFEHHDWQGHPTGDVVRRGGQSVPQAKEWWALRGLAAPPAEFVPGHITAYRTHPLYDYACGDARLSYPPEWGVEEITRQFLYLKPDVFVIYDRLVLADPATRPCWMLHSLREPRSDGGQTALTPEQIGPQLLCSGAQRVPHPSPGGQYQMDGDRFTVESGSPHQAGGGWLSVRTLLPATADAERRKIGGEGHDFEVAGVQYGLLPAGYKLADDDYAVGSTIGPLGWRVELRPKVPSRTVEFLHVLQVGATGQLADAVRGASMQTTDTTRVITVPCGARVFTVTFNRTGPRGGGIALQAPAQAQALSQPLPEGIEDHWRAYRDDPDYTAWTTDPRYRVVIEP